MTVTAQLADGRTLEFPDGTDPGVVQATVKKMLGVAPSPAAAPAAPPVERGMLDSIMGGAKAIGSGAAEGVASGLGLPADAINMLSGLGDKLSGATPPKAPHGPLPTSKEIIEYAGTDYKPQGTFERYAKSGAAGVTGMLKGGPIAAGLGLASGLGAQAAGDVSGDNPWARLAGGAAPFAAASPWAMRVPNAVKAVKSFMGETSDEALQKAQAVRNAAEKSLGTKVLLNQGLDDPHSLSAIVGEVAKSKQGASLQTDLAKQLPAGQDAITKFIESTGGRNPSQAIANELLQAGKSALDAPRQQRTDLTRDLYADAKQETIRPENIVDASDAIKGVAKTLNLPGVSQAGAATRKAARQVEGLIQTKPGTPAGSIVDERGQPLIPEVPATGLPVNAMEVKTLAREKANSVDKVNPTSQQINAKVANDSVHNILKETAAPPGSALEAADSEYSRLSNELVKPVEESALTTMFPASQRTAKYPKGDYEAMGQVFDSSRFGPGDVRFAAENLNRANPQAWPDLVKQHIKSTYDSVNKIKEGRTSEQVLNDFVNEIKSPNFTEAMKGVANATGQDAQAVADGAEKLLDALKVVSRDRGSVGQVNVGEFERLAGTNMVSGLTRNINLIQPLRGIGRAIERNVRGGVYGKIADALTSPDGVRMLTEIKNYSPTDERLRAMAQGLLSVNATAREAQ